MREIMSCIRNLPIHLKHSFQNIWRNGVMSFSSIFAVTITLVLIGVIGVLALNVQQITTDIEEGVRIYVKLERSITSEEEAQIGANISAIANVKVAQFSSRDQELDKFIEKQGEDGKLFESYRKDNPLGAAYYVEVKDASLIEQTNNEIVNIPNVNSTQYGGQATKDMVGTLQSVRTGGSIFIIGLAIVALFMIANTIKITISARQTEIEIMRMVGASNWYIRIPFMLEGVLIGIIGSIIPIIVLIYGYGAIYDYTGGMLVSSMMMLKEPYPFITDFSLVLMALGTGVGLIGSYVSVRRFLKF